MLRTMLCAGLAACALPVHAETWTFTYQGFHDQNADTFVAERMLTGSFAGQDSDGDGTVSRAEITSLILNGYDYVGCQSQSNEFWQCGTEAFSYTPGSALQFTAGQGGADPEGWVGAGHYYVSGQQESGFSFRPGQFDIWAYQWTPQTTFAISSAPEPATWALMLGGLPLAAWATRRRKPTAARGLPVGPACM
jgi:hypothetical protein